LQYATDVELKPVEAWGRGVSVLAQRALLAQLVQHARRECGCVWAGVDVYANAIGSSTGHVRRVLEALCEQGVLVRRARLRRADGTLGAVRYQLAGAAACEHHAGLDEASIQRAPGRAGDRVTSAHQAALDDTAKTDTSASLARGPARPQRADQRAPVRAQEQGYRNRVKEQGKQLRPAKKSPARARENELVDTREIEVLDAPSPNGPRPRRRDDLFEAVVAALGLGKLTSSARGALNKALKELREVDADPAEVPLRVEVLRRQWRGDVKVTPNALAKHWHEADPTNPANYTAADRRQIEIEYEIRRARADEQRQGGR
jgi:hypothetical protein